MFNIILATQTSKKNTKCILQIIHVETLSYNRRSPIKTPNAFYREDVIRCCCQKKCTHSQPFLPNARRHMFFFHPSLSSHTHIGSEEKSRFFFLCSYLALCFLTSFELFLRHFQSGCNLPSFEPSSALIGRSSNCICNMGLGYVSISRGLCSSAFGKWSLDCSG